MGEVMLYKVGLLTEIRSEVKFAQFAKGNTAERIISIFFCEKFYFVVVRVVVCII